MNSERNDLREQLNQVDIHAKTLIQAYKRTFICIRDKSYLIDPDLVERKAELLPNNALRLAALAAKPGEHEVVDFVRNVHLLVELKEIEVSGSGLWSIQINNSAVEQPAPPHEPDRILRAMTENNQKEYAITRPQRLAAQWRILTAAKMHPNEYEVTDIGGRFLITGKKK